MFAGIDNLKNLPLNIEKYFNRDNNYSKLYRGLAFTDDMLHKYLPRLTENDLTKYKLGDYIPINLKGLTSWTTEYKVTDNYSEYCYDNKASYSIVLKLENVKRYSVLADVDKTLESTEENTEEESDSDDSDHEIILYPGRFRCKIIKIYKNCKEQDFLTFDIEKYNSIDN